MAEFESLTNPKKFLHLSLSMASDPTTYLKSAQFSTPSTSTTTYSPDEQPTTAADVLSGGASFDPARLHPLAGIKDQLEFLQLDDDKTNEMPGSVTALPTRGWGDDLCYGTGTTYLSGITFFLLRL
jgi:import inner membrane translocase subunit TIM23